MPRNVQDIIPSGGSGDRRSIRNIPIPEGRRKVNLVEALPPEQAEAIPHRRTTDSVPIHRVTAEHESFPPIRPERSSRKIVWISAIIAVIALVFVALSLFKGATLTYVPKSATLSFNKDTYTAFKSGQGNLIFSVIKLSDTQGISAPASGGQAVSLKASGTIVVYNNEKTAQKLVKTTRFQTADGKIYRVQSDITVPAQSAVAGVATPGSLAIQVVADQPGAYYNIGLSDFTLPGLKGDPRFATVYARSKTPMTGGLVGTQKQVSAADLATAKTTLETGLKTQLLTEAKAQVPTDFILFSNLATVTFSELPQTNPTDSTVTVNEQGDFYGIMFKKADLAAYLASKKSSGLSGTVDLPDLSSLDIEQISQTAPNATADSTTFQVSGSATVVAVTDENALKTSLVGTQKSDLQTVLQKYPGIDSASAVIRPFWSSVFPNDPSKISIIQTPLK